MRKLNVRRRTQGGLARKKYVGEVIDAVEQALPPLPHGWHGGDLPPSTVIAVVSGPVAGQKGKFLARYVDLGTAKAGSTADLSVTDLGEQASGDDVVIWYLPQLQDVNRTLATGLPVSGFPLDVDADGRLIVLVPAGNDVGKYEGQVHTMLSDLVDGWDFLKLHSA